MYFYMCCVYPSDMYYIIMDCLTLVPLTELFQVYPQSLQNLIIMTVGNNEISDLVSRVKIKVQDFEVNIESSQTRSKAAIKKERENKKLVSLVSLLTNKLIK